MRLTDHQRAVVGPKESRNPELVNDRFRYAVVVHHRIELPAVPDSLLGSHCELRTAAAEGGAPVVDLDSADSQPLQVQVERREVLGGTGAYGGGACEEPAGRVVAELQQVVPDVVAAVAVPRIVRIAQAGRTRSKTCVAGICNDRRRAASGRSRQAAGRASCDARRAGRARAQGKKAERKRRAVNRLMAPHPSIPNNRRDAGSVGSIRWAERMGRAGDPAARLTPKVARGDQPCQEPFGAPGGCAFGRSPSAERQVGHREDGEPGERAHHCAVDPDELQVLAHLEFDLLRRFLGVPAGHRIRDHPGNV